MGVVLIAAGLAIAAATQWGLLGFVLHPNVNRGPGLAMATLLILVIVGGGLANLLVWLGAGMMRPAR